MLIEARPKKERNAAPAIVQHQPETPIMPNAPVINESIEAIVILPLLFDLASPGLAVAKRLFFDIYPFKLIKIIFLSLDIILISINIKSEMRGYFKLSILAFIVSNDTAPLTNSPFIKLPGVPVTPACLP